MRDISRQGLQAKCKEAEDKLRHYENLNYQVKDCNFPVVFEYFTFVGYISKQELETRCKAAEDKLSQNENMDYKV